MSSTRLLNSMHSPSDNVRRIDRIWRPGVMSSQYQASAFHTGMSGCFSSGVFLGVVAIVKSAPVRMSDSPTRYVHRFVEPPAEIPGELGQNESGSAWSVFPRPDHAARFAAYRGTGTPRAAKVHASAERERTSNRRREGAAASMLLTVETGATRARP